MSIVSSGSREATVVSLRAWSKRHRSTAAQRGGHIQHHRSPHLTRRLRELAYTWQKITSSSGPSLATEEGERVSSGVCDPDAENICRRMMQVLGSSWSSKIVACDRGNEKHCVLFVWRDDVIADPVATDRDTLWILEPGSQQIRGVDIESEYSYWSIKPVAFVDFLCGRTPVPA